MKCLVIAVMVVQKYNAHSGTHPNHQKAAFGKSSWVHSYFITCKIVPETHIFDYMSRYSHLNIDFQTYDFIASDYEFDRLWKYQTQYFTVYSLKELFSSYRMHKKLLGGCPNAYFWGLPNGPSGSVVRGTGIFISNESRVITGMVVCRTHLRSEALRDSWVSSEVIWRRLYYDCSLMDYRNLGCLSLSLASSCVFFSFFQLNVFKFWKLLRGYGFSAFNLP